MLLFRPTPRIRAPSKASLTHCYQSAEATIALWKQLYNSDRMSYSWTSIHSICLSAIIILYSIWMVRELTTSTEIDSLTETMVSASNLLSAAGEHWIDARRCRNSLNNLTAATVRWLITLRSSPQVRGRSGEGDQADTFAHSATMEMMNETNAGQQHVFHHDNDDNNQDGGRLDGSFNMNFPGVDTYINGEDLANLFNAPNPCAADLSSTMEGMFSDYQPLFDFYQGNDFGM